MPRSPFWGPGYIARSPNAADAECRNLYPTLVESKGEAKEIGAFYTTPALKYLTTVGTGPIRALYSLVSPNISWGLAGADLQVYGVSGNQFFTMDNSGTATVVGTLASPRGAYSYTPTTNVLAPITLPFVPAASSNKGVWITSNGVQIGIFLGMSADQQDGFVLINEPLTYKIWQSALLDLTAWDALNFASASGNPDDIIALIQIHRELFIGKDDHFEVWGLAGGPGFAFQRFDGVYIENGLVAPRTLRTVGEGLIWLGRNTQGVNIVVHTPIGYQPLRVSNHYIERQIATASFAEQQAASAWVYLQDGHTFYVLNIGDQTFAYDVTVSHQAGQPMWHVRDTIDTNGEAHRHWVDAACTFNDQILVGDYRNGNLYTLDADIPYDTDAARSYPRRWLRSWRAMPQPTDDPTRFSWLRLDMETGIHVPQGLVGPGQSSPVPYCTLEWSDDGGHKWSDGMLAPVGALGETARRVMFRRLGSTRRQSGLDRLFRVSSGDCFPAALIGAELQ